jgi:ribose-phosphate pyrophosphokinase
MYGDLMVFSGTANRPLAEATAQHIGIPLGGADVEKFPNSNTFVRLHQSVRAKDVFIIQPTAAPVNDNLMELLLYLDALRRASTHSISVVIPYFPYARQERMARGREPISARVVANLLETMGASRVIFVDIHSRAIQGFFNIPVDPLSALPLLVEYFNQAEFTDSAVVSPDVGRAGLAGRFAEQVNLPLVVMHKRRKGFTETETTHVVGDIRGRRPILIDDLMAGGSVLRQLDSLYAEGAIGKACVAVTHPILLPSALEILDKDDRIERLVVTDTIPLPPEKRHPKIDVITVAPLLADIIASIHQGISISPKLILA